MPRAPRRGLAGGGFSAGPPAAPAPRAPPGWLAALFGRAQRSPRGLKACA